VGKGKMRKRAHHPHPYYGFPGESRAQMLARLHATKCHAKRRARKLRFARAKDTPTLKAERAAKAVAAAVKAFAVWLQSPEAQAAAAGSQGVGYGLVSRVRAALRDHFPKPDDE